MTDYIFLNGNIVDEDAAQINIKDLALLRGYGIFDFLRTVNKKKPFLIEKHLNRFYISASTMGLSIDYSRDFLLDIIKQLLEMNSYVEAGIRMVLTGGYSPNAFEPTESNIFIVIEPIHLPSPSQFEIGAKLITHNYHREWSRVKTINYITSIRLINDKRKADAIEVLYKIDGKIHECSRSNFFIVKDGVLITAEDDVLQGITRGTVIEIAKRSMKVELREVLEEELMTADEAFITGTTIIVTPIVKIDDIEIGNGKPGPVTRKLLAEFLDFEKNY
ncbi:aminotransferase class IV [Bacteroidota bacterium]